MGRKRIVSFALVICLIIGSANVYIFDVWGKAAEAYDNLKKERAIAEDLASMTGKSADSLLQMKAISGSWNSVINTLGNTEEIERMTNAQLQQLIAENGFSEDSVSDADVFVSQILFNLEEILRNDSLDSNMAAVSMVHNAPVNNTPVNNAQFHNAPVYNAPFDNDPVDNDMEAYRKIGQAFDKNLATFYALKLQDKLGSIQNVIDEYLYCLQIDVDLGLLMIDGLSYEKALADNGVILTREGAITAEDISSRMLAALQSKRKASPVADRPELPMSVSNDKPINQLIAMPKDPRPPDPAKEAMDEIDKINNSWMKTR